MAYQSAENGTCVQTFSYQEISDGTRYFFISCMAFILLFGVPGNAVIICIQTRLRSKSSTDICILAMAIVDMLSAMFNTTLYVLQFEPSVWNLVASHSFCRSQNFTLYVTNICSTLLLATTAYTRLARIKQLSVLEPPEHISRIRRMCIGIAVFGCVYSLVSVFLVVLDQDTSTCEFNEEYSYISYILAGGLSLIFICSFVVVCACYISIAVLFRRHRRTVTPFVAEVPIRRESQTCTKEAKVQPSAQNENPPSISYNIASNQVFMARPYTTDYMETTTQHSISLGTETETTFIQQSTSPDSVSDRRPLKNIKESDVDSKKPVSSIKPANHRSEPNPFRKNIKVMKRITTMLFLITSIYVGTWIIIMTIGFYTGLCARNDATFLAGKSFMINCLTNPLLYIIMSKQFRQNALELFCKSKSRHGLKK